MKKIISAVLIFAFLGVLGFTNIDQGKDPILEEYKILKGQIAKIEANNIRRVLVIEKEVVSVVKAEKDYIEVIGVKSGETLVELYSGDKKLVFKVIVESKDLRELKAKIEQLVFKQLALTGISVSTNVLTGKILLEGQLEKDDLGKLNKILESNKDHLENFIVEKISTDIVEIDVEIVELSSDAARQLGVTLPAAFAFGETNSAVMGGSGMESVTDQKAIKPFFGFMRNYSRTSLGAAISFLEQQGKARVLSKPRLACLSGKEAELLVGGEVPFMSSVVTEGGAATGVEYKEYGIELKVSPTVLSDKNIEIKLNVGVTDVEESEALGGAVVGAAAITPLARPTKKRSTSTTLLMQDSQTLVISGLIREKSEESISKYPWLGDVPILGAFFRHRSQSTGGGSGGRGNVELVVMLTPRLIEHENKEEKRIKEYQERVKAQPLSKTTIARVARYDDKIIAYTQKVREKIVSSLHYPWDAKEAGWQAEVRVKLHIAADGTLIDSQMLEFSGYRIFDQAIEKTINEIPRYPAFPSDIEEKELWVEVPIVYQMK